MAIGDFIHRFIGRLTGNKADGTLRCHGCRREIAGLPADARCPDCGESVLGSLLRRVPAIPDDAENVNDHPARKPYEFIKTETGYPVDAYLFIADVLLRLRQRLAEGKGQKFSNNRHVSAVEVGEGLREFAVSFFGDNAEARDVLRSWNVLRSEDVGEIIRRMVDAGLLAAGAHDRPDAFVGLFTLQSLFGAEGVAMGA